MLYLFVAALVIVTAKFGLAWIAQLRSGHYLSLPLRFVVVMLAASAIWATLREAGRQGERRAGVYLWSLLLGVLLMELAVFAFRTPWG